MILPRIVGLTGYARSGKDTVGNFLVGSFGYTRLSFAEPVYEAVYRLNPMITHASHLQPLVEGLGWEQVKVTYPEVRRLLQHMGTEVGREMFGDDFWVEQAFKKINSDDEDKRYVITDVRFPNELHAIESAGGNVARIIRPGNEPVNTHISDNAFQDQTWEGSIILNSGTLPELEVVVTDWIYSKATE